jgi:Uncharacterized conserved protein (DUF2340)
VRGDSAVPFICTAKPTNGRLRCWWWTRQKWFARPATINIMSGFDDTLTNLARPKSSATITVRVIKSFEFRTERSLVLRNVNLETTTVGGLKTIVRNGMPPPLPRNCAVVNPISHSSILLRASIAIQTQPGWKPYRTAHFGLPSPILPPCQGFVDISD